MGKIKEYGMEEQERQLAAEETGLSFELSNLMTSNKAFRTDLAQRVVQDVKDGIIDPLEAFIYANKGQEVFDAIVTNIRPIIAGTQIQKGGIKMYDAEIIEKKNPDKYDYSVCSDAEWDKLNAQLTDIKAKMKERETFLKTLKEPMATMDGEIINPPSITYGAMNIAITLK
jgi:hypothetical protein